MIKAAFALWSYLSGVWVLLVMFCILPGQAVALISPQSYSRVVAQAEWIAYRAASRTATVAAVSAAAATASPASIAIRAVTGPIGWAALGITVGLALYETFYPAEKLSALKEAARPAGTATAGGRRADGYVQGTPGSCGSLPNGTAICSDAGSDQSATCTSSGPTDSGCPWSTLPLGWEGVTCTASGPEGCNTWYYRHRVGQANLLQVSPGADPTATQVATVLGGLAPADPNSIESNSGPLDAGQAPSSASSVQSVPVSPTDLPSTVKKSEQVVPSDLVIANNVSPQPGLQTDPVTQTTTTKTETTVNPDGSETKEEVTTVQCSMGSGHDTRTLETIFAEHQAAWMATGFLGMLGVIQALTWPDTLGSFTIELGVLGTHIMDFNAYAWVFTILRTFVIFFATFLGYRIIWG